MCCGERRKVVGPESPVLAWLGSGGFFDVPHKASIKNQLVMGSSGNESGFAKYPVRAMHTRFKC